MFVYNVRLKGDYPPTAILGMGGKDGVPIPNMHLQKFPKKFCHSNQIPYICPMDNTKDEGELGAELAREIMANSPYLKELMDSRGSTNPLSSPKFMIMDAAEETYFTPSIEDIRVGYEMEIPVVDIERRECGICKVVVDSVEWAANNLGYEDNGQGKKYLMEPYRVPFLTKEQIIAEGWEYVSVDNFSKRGLHLVWNTQQNRIRIITGDFGWIWDQLYQGECKDVNTFRLIMKLLKIK